VTEGAETLDFLRESRDFARLLGGSPWPRRCSARGVALREAHSSSNGVPTDILRRAWNSCFTALTPHAPATFDDDTSSRQLFDLLDGRIILAANQPWQITVYAVVDDGISRWIQMTVGGKSVSAVTLRLMSGDGSKPAIRALAQWLNATHDPVPEVVSTSRCA